jgi:hypothetical protein
MIRRLSMVLAAGFVTTTHAAAQSAADSTAVIAAAQAALKAISTKDTALARTVLQPGMQFVAMTDPAAPAAAARVQSDSAFYAQIATAKQTYLERMWSPVAVVRGTIAVVHAPYDFHVDGAFSHCGTDTFTLAKSRGKWMITHIAYTVQRTGCAPSPPSGTPSP